MKNLEIAAVQTKPTDVPPPSLKKKTRKQIEKRIDPLSHPLIEESKVRRSDSLNWRKWFKEIKTKRTKIPKTTIEEEIDEEQWKTHTLNPNNIHDDVLYNVLVVVKIKIN